MSKGGCTLAGMVLVALSSWSCAGSTAPDAPPEVATIVVSPLLSTLAIDAQLPLQAEVRDDAGAVVPEQQLAAIATVPFLDVLPLRRKEALASALGRLERAAGTTLFSAGDHGDRLYILSEGTIEIDLPSGPKVEHAPAFVGEIALLRDVPRTATVRVTADSVFWTLDAEHFLDAVAGHSRSRATADTLLASRGMAFGA